MSNLRMTSDLRRQLILAPPSAASPVTALPAPQPRAWRPPRPFRKGCCSSTSPPRPRSMRRSSRGMRGRSGTRASARAGTLDRDRWLNSCGGMVGLSSTSLERFRPGRGAAPALHGREPSRGRRVRALLYGKIADLIGPTFVTSLQRAVEAGDAAEIGGAPLNLFWFAHHTVLTAAMTRLPVTPCLEYGDVADLERQLCQFILRGIGLGEACDRRPSGPRLVIGTGTIGSQGKCIK